MTRTRTHDERHDRDGLLGEFLWLELPRHRQWDALSPWDLLSCLYKLCTTLRPLACSGLVSFQSWRISYSTNPDSHRTRDLFIIKLELRLRGKTTNGVPTGRKLKEEAARGPNIHLGDVPNSKVQHGDQDSFPRRKAEEVKTSGTFDSPHLQ